MAIVQTIIDPYYFWNWVKQSDSYSNNFSLEGAKALQEYLEDYSDETGEDIKFDPIAWCCEFTEFNSVLEAWRNYHDENVDAPEYDEMLEWLQDRTTVIEFDGGVIAEEF